MDQKEHIRILWEYWGQRRSPLPFLNPARDGEREDQKEADRQRRIEECAKEIRYWHRMQADMGHAGKNLREILFRYIT